MWSGYWGNPKAVLAWTWSFWTGLETDSEVERPSATTSTPKTSDYTSGVSRTLTRSTSPGSAGRTLGWAGVVGFGQNSAAWRRHNIQKHVDIPKTNSTLKRTKIVWVAKVQSCARQVTGLEVWVQSLVPCSQVRVRSRSLRSNEEFSWQSLEVVNAKEGASCMKLALKSIQILSDVKSLWYI